MLKIYTLKRCAGIGICVYSVDGGPLVEKRFPASVKDNDLLKMLGFVQETEPIPEPVKAEEPKEDPVPEEKPKQKVNEIIEDKRVLKGRYLRDLKSKGVDMKGERSFAKIEEAWKKYCSAE